MFFAQGRYRFQYKVLILKAITPLREKQGLATRDYLQTVLFVVSENGMIANAPISSVGHNIDTYNIARDNNYAYDIYVTIIYGIINKTEVCGPRLMLSENKSSFIFS